MKKYFIIFFGILLISGMIIFFAVKNKYQSSKLLEVKPQTSDSLKTEYSDAKIKIGNFIFNVEIAKTQEQKIKGLSGRQNLAENNGMLFIFDKPAIYNFWMKDMDFPIDIIWINGDKIVGVSENLKPMMAEKDMIIYSAPTEADKVLEIKAGAFKKIGAKIFDKIEILDNKILEFPIKSTDNSLLLQEKSNLIVVDKPLPNELVKSPLIVEGKARGNWFFEATFPVKILDANGHQLGIHYAQAEGDWMSTEFVPYKSVLEFENPLTDTGSLILEKDNPSGLPKFDDKLIIPIRFK